jgi:hypothetical protein
LDHGSPSVFVGPIAGGEKVIASNRAPTAEFLRKFYSDALAVEMEGRGFLEAVNINALVMGGVVRGISDLLSGKAEADARGSQALAADAACAAVFEILHTLPPSAQSRERKPIKKPPPKPTKPRSRGPRRKPASALDVVSGATLATPSFSETPSFLETPSTSSKAVYFNKDEVLAKIGIPNVDEVSFSYFDPPDAYLRIIPMSPLPHPLSLATLREAATRVPVPMLKKRLGNLVAVNEYGVIAYDPAHSSRGGPAPLNWATQLFRNGELWAMSNTMIVRKRDGRPEWLPLPLLPAFVFEELYYDTLHSSVPFAIEHLSLKPPFQIELGLLHTKGMHIGINTDDIRGPAQANEAVSRVALPDAERESINSALLEFFNQVHDLSGYRRPLGLHGFPPGPPRP